MTLLLSSRTLKQEETQNGRMNALANTSQRDRDGELSATTPKKLDLEINDDDDDHKQNSV